MINNTFKTSWLLTATVGMATLTFILAPEYVLISTGGAFAVTAALIYILNKAEKEADDFFEKKHHKIIQ